MNPTTTTPPIYDVDYFIAKFTAIPEERWCIGRLTKLHLVEQHCAFGHCEHKHDSLDDIQQEEGTEARALSDLMFRHYHVMGWQINDQGETIYGGPVFDQPSPKRRILAALENIKKKQTSTT